MISSPSDIVMNLDDPVEGEVVISGEANEMVLLWLTLHKLLMKICCKPFSSMGKLKRWKKLVSYGKYSRY